MWELRVLGWWAVVRALWLLKWSLAGLMYLPMGLLEMCCDGRDAAEVEWLLACTRMRLARRRRLNFRGEVGDGERG